MNPDSRGYSGKTIIGFLTQDQNDTVFVQDRTDPHTGIQFRHVCLQIDDPIIAAKLKEHGYDQDPDVLDTWFSSALWPHATLGWPETKHNPPLADGASTTSSSDTNEVLNYFYPGSVLVTSRDIITLWVARMVLTGIYNMRELKPDPKDQVPFKHVCIHPKIQDGFGQTMSKTKGNGVDPIELIEKYGCDGCDSRSLRSPVRRKTCAFQWDTSARIARRSFLRNSII